MVDAELPPANLILQALHGIRSDLRGVHEELRHMHEAQNTTNQRLDRVEQGLDRVAKRTTEGFVETNTKLAALAHVVQEHDRRLDHLLTAGLGSEVRELRARVTRLESARRVSAPGKKR